MPPFTALALVVTCFGRHLLNDEPRATALSQQAATRSVPPEYLGLSQPLPQRKWRWDQGIRRKESTSHPFVGGAAD